MAGELTPMGADGFYFYPDAPVPGQPLRPKVDLLVTIEPAIAGLGIAHQHYDVDGPDWDPLCRSSGA